MAGGWLAVLDRLNRFQAIRNETSLMRRFVASFGSGAAGEWTFDTMFFGHNGEGETLRYLADSGLRVRDSSVGKQDRGSLVYVG